MSRAEPSPLTAAAEALDAELGRYEALAGGLARERLDSEKNLRRAGQVLVELQDSESRLGAHLEALAGALGDARRRQQEQAEGVRGCAERIRQRSDRLTDLLGRWQALGEDAREVNRLVQASGGSAEPGATLDEMDTRLGRLAEAAAGLVRQAEADGFPDLGRQAESLRVQLLAVGNKFRLMNRRDPASS